jgi:hypothetical protein
MLCMAPCWAALGGQHSQHAELQIAVLAARLLLAALIMIPVLLQLFSGQQVPAQPPRKCPITYH